MLTKQDVAFKPFRDCHLLHADPTHGRCREMAYTESGDPRSAWYVPDVLNRLDVYLSTTPGSEAARQSLQLFRDRFRHCTDEIRHDPECVMPFDRLQLGEWFWWRARGPAAEDAVRNAADRYAKAHGMRFSVRKEGDGVKVRRMA